MSPQPLIKLRISKGAILSNYRAFSQMTNLAIAPVLKSNAYGHGLMQVAHIVDKTESPFLVVDSFYEAMRLRMASIRKPLLIIGYSTLEQIETHLHNTSYTITNLEMLELLSTDLKVKRIFHLKIDTGMRRQGIEPQEIPKAIDLIKSNKNVILEGLCSHLSDADSQEKSFTLLQIRQWNEAVKKFKKGFANIKYFHISATSGSYYRQRIDANLMRLGIGLYGVNRSPQFALKLLPALGMDSIVTAVKNLKAGEGLGYNLTYRAKTDKTIAVVPVGYYEGLDRRLSNKGSVLIDGLCCPIVGRVCMNICMVDVSKIVNVGLNHKVTVISNDADACNSIEKLARLCDTNPHELLVHIPWHLRREIVE